MSAWETMMAVGFRIFDLVVIYQTIGTQIHSAFEHVLGDLCHGAVMPHVRTPWMFDQHTTPTFDLILDLLNTEINLFPGIPLVLQTFDH
jgi:hypothetical protein